MKKKKKLSQKEKFLRAVKEEDCEIQDFEKKLVKASSSKPISNQQIKTLLSKRTRAKRKKKPKK